jgi:hypothetical protein
MQGIDRLFHRRPGLATDPDRLRDESESLVPCQHGDREPRPFFTKLPHARGHRPFVQGAPEFDGDLAHFLNSSFLVSRFDRDERVSRLDKELQGGGHDSLK